MSLIRCEKCSSDNFAPVCITEALNYRNGRYEIEFETMLCQDCGKDDYTTPDQSKALTEKLIRAHNEKSTDE